MTAVKPWIRGYVNYLSDAEKLKVLAWAREALGKGVSFVAGAYIEGRDGEVVALYREQMDAIVKMGGIPILFQTARLHGKPSKEKVAAYQAACHGYPHVLGFELGRMFAPNGEIFDVGTVQVEATAQRYRDKSLSPAFATHGPRLASPSVDRVCGGGVVSAVIVAADLTRHRQKMWIMDIVWPLTALYAGPFGVWAYSAIGRNTPRRNGKTNRSGKRC